MSEAEAFRVLQPQEYLAKFLQSGVITSAAGSAAVSMGRTSVVAGAKLAIGAPSTARPRDGAISVSVHLPPLCSSRYSIGRPDERALTAGDMVAAALLNTKAIDLEELSIEPGRAAWSVSVDVMCTSDDGNVVDAAIIAAQAVLRSMRIPGVTAIEGGKFEIDSAAESRRLKARCAVVPLTFAVAGDICIVDPVAFEEDVADATFTVGRDSRGSNCIVHKYGGGPVPMPTLRRAQATCEKHVDFVKALLDEAVERTSERPSL